MWSQWCRKEGGFPPLHPQSFKRHLSSTFEEKSVENQNVCVRFLGCKWKSRQTCGLWCQLHSSGAAPRPPLHSRPPQALRCPSAASQVPTSWAEGTNPASSGRLTGCQGAEEAPVDWGKPPVCDAVTKYVRARPGTPLLMSPQRFVKQC